MEAISEWGAYLAELWRGNRLLQGLSLVVASIIVARILDYVLARVVARWVLRTETDLDDQLLKRLHPPIFLSVLVVGLALTTDFLGLAGTVRRVTLGVLGTVVVLSWLLAGLQIITLVVAALSRRDTVRMIDTGTRPLFENLGKVVLLGAASYFLFVVWQADPTGWLASAGIIGIAVGFAARDSLANLFAGVFIFADAPYRIGDYINLDTGERGQVTEIGLRSTRLLTRDDVEITIPNSVIANAKIVNESGGPSPRYRIRVKVGVAYGSDVDQVRALLLEAALTQDSVCREPSPRVRFRSFGDSALELELLCWIDEPVLRGRVLDALHCDIYKRFAAAGVEIPYPKRDVYVRSLPTPGEAPETPG